MGVTCFLKKLRIPIVLWMVLIITACSTGTFARPDAKEYHRTVSHAIPQSAKTSLGEALKQPIAAHPGQSGFMLLVHGSASFEMRLALIQAAEKTLDIQYYLVNDDKTANLLLEAILQAAARGVRVRFLIDNIGLDEVNRTLSMLDGVKNIEIRVFNPFVTRDQPFLSRVIGIFTDIGQITKRMHNKTLISDNQLAIIGGRNLGDEYFDEDKNSNFNDIDILSAGPATADISRSFDRYWNSDEAFPISVLERPASNPENIARIRAALRQEWAEASKSRSGKRILNARLAEGLKNSDIDFIWAPGEVVVDTPEKIKKDKDVAESKPLLRFTDIAEKAAEEIIIVSPYFVPQKEGTEWLAKLVKRGIKVRVLTNSLASTDVVVVHTGYRRYRREIVEAGIELYEMKPINSQRPRQRMLGSTAPPRANLHGKFFVIDRRHLIIGSQNFDPRSDELNTEIAFHIHSKVLGEKTARLAEEIMSPENSYQVIMNEDKNLDWRSREKGEIKISRHADPKAGILRRIEVFLFSLLPLENQL